MAQFETVQELANWVVNNTSSTQIQEFYEFNDNNQSYHKEHVVSVEFDKLPDLATKLFIMGVYASSSRVWLNITHSAKTPVYDLAEDCCKEFTTHPPGGWGFSGKLEGIIKAIPDDKLKDYATTSVLKKERSRRRELEFNATKPNLKLDMFSYIVFENLLKSKKYITGVDAVNYMSEILPSTYINNNYTQAELDIKVKYMNLIWNKARTKTNHLISTIRDCRSIDCTNQSDLPFKYIWYETALADVDDNNVCDNIAFSNDFYNSVARNHKLPVSTSILAVYSTDYMYVSGVTKPSKLDDREANLLRDKLVVLNYLLSTNTNGKYYLTTARDQLLEVFNSGLVSDELRDKISTDNAFSAYETTMKQLNKEQ